MKFKAWDGKQWRTDFVIMPDGGLIRTGIHRIYATWGSCELLEIIEEVNWKVVRSTGLTDKNGVEIWEGDIVKGDLIADIRNSWGDTRDNYPTMRVIGMNERGGFEVQFVEKQIRNRRCSGYCFSKRLCGETVVIGNIFESPELIEATP